MVEMLMETDSRNTMPKSGSFGRMSRDLYDDRMVVDASTNRNRPNTLRQPFDQRTPGLPIGTVTTTNTSNILGPNGAPYQSNETFQIMGHDGGSEMGYANKGSRRYGGGLDKGDEGSFWDRWADYRKLLKEKYPWVRGKKLHKMISVPIHYGMYHLYDALAPISRDSMGQIIWGGVTDTMKLMHKTQYKSIPFEVFPRVNTLTTFANGATEIERLYTVSRGGYEIPVHVQLLGGDLPNDDDIIKSIAFVDEFGISPYNKVEHVAEGMIDKQFIARAMDKVTRGDYTRYFVDEPEQLYRWIMKDEMGTIQANGIRDTDCENALPSQISGRVKVYKEPGKKSGIWYRLGQLLGDDTPSSWTMLKRWQIMDWTYDISDLLFGPAEATFRRLDFPKQSLRHLLDAQYKIAAGVSRRLTCGNNNYFTFEIPGKDRTLRESAKRSAIKLGYN